MDLSPDVLQFTADSLQNLKFGDLLEIPRLFYSHWAIYIGNGEVMHICSRLRLGMTGLRKAVVRVEKLSDIVKSCRGFCVNNSLDGTMPPIDCNEICKRIADLVGREGYDLLFWNCETMSNYCRYGCPVSMQIVAVLRVSIGLYAGFIIGKKTANHLKEKIGFKKSMVVGFTIGLGTTALVIKTTMVSNILMVVVINISEQVMSSWIAADLSKAGCIVVSFLILNSMWKKITGETIQDGVKRVYRRFKKWIGSFAHLLSSWVPSRRSFSA